MWGKRVVGNVSIKYVMCMCFVAMRIVHGLHTIHVQAWGLWWHKAMYHALVFM